MQHDDHTGRLIRGVLGVGVEKVPVRRFNGFAGIPKGLLLFGFGFFLLHANALNDPFGLGNGLIARHVCRWCITQKEPSNRLDVAIGD